MGNKTSALAEEVAHVHHAEEEEEGLNTRLISIFIFLLVLFTLAAETGLDALHEALGEASSVGNQILSKVKNEVMLVGVLSLGLTLAEGVWRELNSDEVGGVDFGEFTTFVDPAFHRPLPKSVDCGPKLDLGAATPAKSPPKRHDSLFGALPSMAGLFPAEEDDAAAS